MNCLPRKLSKPEIREISHISHAQTPATSNDFCPTSLNQAQVEGGSPILHPADAMGDLMIRFENVTKIYPGQERPALDSVNLEIVKGEFVFLVGLSGSGKSTFLRLVLREERPTTGGIHVAGKDLGTLAKHKVPELRRQVGTVFQDFRLLPNKTIT